MVDTSGYGSKWLKAEEFKDSGSLRAEILDEAVKQGVGDKGDEQLVFSVRMDDRIWKVGVNVSNWEHITSKFGMDSKVWVGKWLVMTAKQVDFKGTRKWGWEMKPDEVQVENVSQ